MGGREGGKEISVSTKRSEVESRVCHLQFTDCGIRLLSHRVPSALDFEGVNNIKTVNYI